MKTRFLLLLLLALGCRGGPSGPASIEGPAPVVTLAVQQRTIPFIGSLQLVPQSVAAPWSYTVDIDGNEEIEHAGLVNRPITIDLRFDTPRVYRIRVVLTGQGGQVVIERAVLAIDPDFDPGVPVIAQGLVEAPVEEHYFEGITLDPAGRSVYVATYTGGELFRLDASTLATLDSAQLRHGVEGLAVSPGSEVLFAVHKILGVSVLDVPSLVIEEDAGNYDVGAFFVHALDSRQVLVGGRNGLALYDAVARTVLSRLHDSAPIHGPFHFAVHPSGFRVAAASPGGSSIALAEIPTLAVAGSIDTPGLRPRYVAFNPREDILYALATHVDTFDHHFLVVDIASGTVLTDVNLGRRHCFNLCVANPVATSRNGEWIVFASYSETFFVNTSTHELFIAGMLGSGVAASPIRDEFYFVDSQGVVTRVGYPTR